MGEFEDIMGKLDAEVGREIQEGGKGVVVIDDAPPEEEPEVDLHEKELAEQGFDKYGKPLKKIKSGRYASQDPKVQKYKRIDAMDLRGRGQAKGISFIQRPACESQVAIDMFTRVYDKPRWAVDGCVTLRARGVCEVCGETVRAQGRVMQVDPSCRGGKYAENNCLYVCKHCAECWYPNKTFNHFMGPGATVHTLSVAVMERRKREFRKCKYLSPEACLRFKEMYEVERKRTIELHKKADESRIRSLNEEI